MHVDTDERMRASVEKLRGAGYEWQSRVSWEMATFKIEPKTEAERDAILADMQRIVGTWARVSWYVVEARTSSEENPIYEQRAKVEVVR